ncbi:MAG: hypothetical protein C0467_16425 [Planctomycetaceae bacterium]|nr:hypothetical protein [Planctomycetaceae bacterium]
MSQTFVFEELDAPTRTYLTEVRDSGGAGAPGVFALTSSTMAGCGCGTGVVVIIATLLATLTTMFDVIYQDPGRVALLQTAGILLGGWLIFAARRSASRGSKTMAGHWAYIDPLHLYEAYREQITVTPINDVAEANFTHSYNNGTYQNSVVRGLRSAGPPIAITVNNELRAEQMVVFLNYLAWARGSEGGDRASLPPAALGALARYVAENDSEPKDAEGNINLKLIDMAYEEIPEEPKREGRAAPSFMPYVFLLVAGIGTYFAMSLAINPPIHDDAIFSAVITENCEPWFLQMYLLDEKNNTRHREQVKARLGQEYNRAMDMLKQQPPGDPELRKGMVKIMDSLKETIRPVVSLTVSEGGTGPKTGAEKRVEKLRDELVGKVEGRKAHADAKDPEYYEAVGGIMGKLAQIMPGVQPRDGIQFIVPRTPVGIQLIEFAFKPDDATHAHFEITYEFVPAQGKKEMYRLKAKVEVRTDLEAAPVAIYSEEIGQPVAESDFGREVDKLRDRLLLGLVGQSPAGGVQLPPNFPFPKAKLP